MKRVFQKLGRLVPRGNLVRSVLVASSGNIAAIVLALGASPFITRLYDPTALGLYGVFMSLVYLVGVLATLRYEAAISLPTEEKTAVNIVVLCVVVSCVLVMTIGLITHFFGEVFWSLGSVVNLRPYQNIFFLTLIAYAGYEAYSFWIVRYQKYKQLALVRFSYSVGMISTQITAGVIGSGTVGLILGPMVGYGLGCLFLIILFFRHPGFASSVSPLEMVSASSRYRKFAIFATPATLLVKVNSHLPTLLMASLYSLEVAGFCALAQRVVSNPLSALSQPVSRVFFSRAAELHRENLPGLSNLYTRTLSRVLKLAVLPLVIGMAFAPPVFAIVFGERWREAGLFCTIMAPMIFTQLLATILSSSFDVLEKQRYQFAVSFVGTLLSGAAILLSWKLNFSPRSMMIALSAASVVGYLIICGVSWMVVQKYESFAVTGDGGDSYGTKR